MVKPCWQVKTAIKEGLLIRWWSKAEEKYNRGMRMEKCKNEVKSISEDREYDKNKLVEVSLWLIDGSSTLNTDRLFSLSITTICETIWLHVWILICVKPLLYMPLCTWASVAHSQLLKMVNYGLKVQYTHIVRGPSEAEQGTGQRLDLTNMCPQQATNEG